DSAAEQPGASNGAIHLSPSGNSCSMVKAAFDGGSMKAFHFPDLGEGLHEAQIVEWHVAEGDEVAADDPLFSVETDKAVTEVPAPWKGRIAKLCAAVGDTIHVGDEVVRYDGEEAGQLATGATRPQSARQAEAPVQDASHPARRVRAMPAVRILAAELG